MTAVTQFRLDTSPLNVLVMLLLVSVLLNTLLAGAFIGAYAGGQPLTVRDFLAEGARAFGRFFRLSLFSLCLYYAFFTLAVDRINAAIPVWTAADASEMRPFVLYLVRTAAVFGILGIFVMWFDYAKVIIVADDRASSVLAFTSAIWFSIRNAGATTLLFLLLSLAGLLLMALFVLLESTFPQNTGWSIFWVFVLQQAFMFARLGLGAAFYASETRLYLDRTKEAYLRKMNNAARDVL